MGLRFWDFRHSDNLNEGVSTDALIEGGLVLKSPSRLIGIDRFSGQGIWTPLLPLRFMLIAMVGQHPCVAFLPF